MNKTVNINLGGIPFTIDDNAYSKLSSYLEDISSRLIDEASRCEIIKDVEMRIAELFTKSEATIISFEIVNDAIAVIGSADQFGIKNENTQDMKTDKQEAKKLYRNTSNAMLGGVCSGIAEYTGMDLTVIRAISLALLFMAGGGIIYIALWIMVPTKPVQSNYFKKEEDTY